MNEEYFTLQEVAMRFRRTSRTIRRWISEGRLEAVKVRGRILIPQKALQSLEQPVEPTRQQTHLGAANMSRREFLTHVAISLASGVMVVASERALGWYSQWYREMEEQALKEAQARELFEELFGAPGKVRSFHTGTHPDNLAAGQRLAPMFGMYDSKPIPAPQSSQLTVLSGGDLVLIGGPNSTPLTKIVWEFDGPNERELDRSSNPILPLRFYGISNVNSRTLPPERIGWQLEGIGPVSTVRWPFVDTKNQVLHVPQAGKKIEIRGEIAYLPYENYLLVTKLPNFLSPDRQGHPRSWSQFLVFEGTNGIGTRAAELLTQPSGIEALEHVKSKLQGAIAFQALFRVYDIELTEQGFHRFSKIEPLDWAIEPLDITEETYAKASIKANAQLAA